MAEGKSIPPENGGREGKPHVCRETSPAGGLLRLGLRPLMVALDPVRSGPLPPAHRGLRTFPRGAHRAGSHPWQERRGGVTTPDGALARGAGVVRGGALATRHDYCCC